MVDHCPMKMNLHDLGKELLHKNIGVQIRNFSADRGRNISKNWFE